ncbi:ACP S-malonyltransferase [Embleya sp. NPDC050493]|uniref:ACP S-malonyltransferase n=1 Tax=Embleya sp. NPDC050493 TaxID=3363989 RepID=UPI0037BD9BAD
MGSQLEAGSAVVFPGISPCRFDDVAKFMLINPAARALVAEADDRLGYSLVDRYREAPGDYSEFARVAFLVNCLAPAYWAEDALDMRPDVILGASFGGTPAAVYSRSLDFADAVSLTARWGHALDAYFAREHGDVVTQSFARTPADRLAQVLGELDERGEWHEIACHIDEEFHMVSVREAGLDRLNERVRAVGGLPLSTMRPPMHSRLFGPLRRHIEDTVFADLRFRDPKLPVVSDHDGSVLRTGEQIRTLLLDGIVRAVHWPTAVATLRRAGVVRAYVAGPDSLWGRVPCTTRSFEVVPLKPQTAMRPRRRLTAA